MKSTEISFSKILHIYGKYWWRVVVVFVIGAIIGFLVPDTLRVNIKITEFTLPVVVREQPTTNWKDEDTHALIGFVNAWLNHAWEEIVDSNFPGARSYVLLEKDTFHFLVEQDDESIDSVVVQQYASDLYEAFIAEFITDVHALNVELVEGEACLTDAVTSSMVECVPLTTGVETVLFEETYDLGAFLWIGDLSEIQTESQYPYTHFLQGIAAGGCALIALMMVVLVDLTRKSSKAE